MTKTYKQLILHIEQAGQGRQVVIPPGGKFTIGQRGDNDLTLYGQHYPRRYTLIEQMNGSYVLNVQPFIDGKISMQDSTLQIHDLLKHDILPRKGNTRLLNLSPGKEGYIAFDDVKIDFYFKQVAVQTTAELSSLPEFSWHRAMVRNLTSDLVFKSIFLVLLTLNSLIIYSLKDYKVNIEQKLDLDKIPERLARYINVTPTEPLQFDTKSLSSNTETTDENKDGQKSSDSKSSSGNRSRRNSGNSGGNRAASSGLLGLIGGTGASNNASSIVDALVDRGLVADLQSIVGGGTNLKVGKGNTKDAGDPLDQLIGLGGDGSSGGIDDFIADMDEDVPQVTLTKQAKVDLVKPSKKTGSAEALGQRTDQSVMEVILQRQGQITYFYEKYLKRNPNLRGKISVEFTIAANGFVTSAKILESTIDHPQLERDILSLVQRLKFEPISSGNVTMVFPFVFTKLS
ncbi:MAG: TonB family protein [Candidatus Zhuqueibacterota bacterium]